MAKSKSKSEFSLESELMLEIAKELSEAPEVEFRMDAVTAYRVMALLQLAIRHPHAAQYRSLVEQLVENFARGIGPATARSLAQGFDRTFDQECV